jgi:hypothetical protein
MPAATTTAPSKAYVGMLAVTCVAMLIGIGALAMEGEEYGWERTPPKSPAKAVPEYTTLDAIMAQVLPGDRPAPPANNPAPAPMNPPANPPMPDPNAPMPNPPANPPMPDPNAPKPTEPTPPATDPNAPKPAPPAPDKGMAVPQNPVEDRSNPKPVVPGPLPSPLVIPGR